MFWDESIKDSISKDMQLEKIYPIADVRIIAEDFSNLVNAINPKSFFRQTNWYVWELLVMYIVFYIVARLDKSLLKSYYILLAGGQYLYVQHFA